MDNIYTNLCDSVGAYNYVGVYEGEVYASEYNIVTEYPPATAEQRERLEELILKAGYDLFINNTQIGWQYFYTNRGFEADYMCHKDKPQLIYALTQKLVQESVLDKEEVKEALCKNH